MKWYMNLKIKSKLLMTFTIAAIIALTIAVFAIVTLNNVNNDYNYVIHFSEERLNTVNEVVAKIYNLRRVAQAIPAYAATNNTEKVKSLGTEAKEVYNDIKLHLDSYNNLLYTDTMLDQEGKDSRSTKITAVSTLLDQYMTNVIDKSLASGLTGDYETALGAIIDNTPLINDLISVLDELTAFAKTASSDRATKAAAATDNGLLMLVIFSVVGIAAIFIFAIAVARIISKPIVEMLEVARNVSKGNLNVRIETKTKDEIGELSESFSGVVTNIVTMIFDINTMHRKHIEGEMSNRIPMDRYDGAYKEVMMGVNEMVAAYVDMMNDIFKTLKAFSVGDFSVKLKQYQGEQALLNEELNNFADNINSIINEMNLIAKAGSEGRLSERASVSRYKGDWRSILRGFNDVLDAVIAPIRESSDVMFEMSKGNFNVSVNGNYQGDFALIKDALNKTIMSISGYISEISSVLEEMANGNLRVGIQREYIGEFSMIKQSINKIVDSLNTTMNEITIASDQVLAGAKQITESSMQLAEGATTQASSIQELSASMSLIDDQTQDNAKNARNANDLSATSTKNAVAGNNEMTQLLEAMNGIKSSSEGISKIIKVIQDIAFQTNLLALNASVEAARAGEHGKGFAVVAEEVRSLASRSQEAAIDTSQLIDDSMSKVGDGVGIAQETAKALTAIVSNANSVSSLISKISAASDNQAEAVSQVSLGISQISSVVQNNSATSEQAASAAQELNSQAELLKRLISYFQIK